MTNYILHYDYSLDYLDEKKGILAKVKNCIKNIRTMLLK